VTITGLKEAGWSIDDRSLQRYVKDGLIAEELLRAFRSAVALDDQRRLSDGASDLNESAPDGSDIEDALPGATQSQSGACNEERHNADPDSLIMPAAVEGPQPPTPEMKTPTCAPTAVPLWGKALDAALDNWVKTEWGPNFGGMPGWKELLRLAKIQCPGSPVTRDHARNLRQKYATPESKKGGAPTHETHTNR